MDKKILQAFFDKSVAPVIAQGCKAYDSSRAECSYRGPNDTKCAIGHMLTDDQMVRYGIREGMAASDFPSELVVELISGVADDPNLSVSHEDAKTFRTFLYRLQSAHDGAHSGDFVFDFKYRANSVASMFELTPIES